MATFTFSEVCYSDMMEIDYPITAMTEIDSTPITTYAPASILKKPGQKSNKKVIWHDSVIDNEHKATARKQRRHEDYAQGLVDNKCAIIAEEACIQRQANEIRRLQGLWHIQERGAVPPGFEHLYGTQEEVATAIRSSLWQSLNDLIPKRQKSDKNLSRYQRLEKKAERKLKLTASPKSIQVFNDETAESDEIM